MSQLTAYNLQPYLVGLTFLGVIYLMYSLVWRKEGMSMPGGTNNLAFSALVDHPGSSLDYARMRGREGMLGIDQGPTNWGPTSFAEVASSQSAGMNDDGSDNSGVWDNVTRAYNNDAVGSGQFAKSNWNVESMRNRILGGINVEGMRATLNPY